MKKLKTKLQNLPQSPGVYLFKNSKEEILYVGKAKVLKNRIKSYFSQSHVIEPRTKHLTSQIADLEYIMTDTETESLMLENNLIKKYQPRYNVLLKDDKNYQFIKIDYSTPIPQISTSRKIDSKKANFFGPYTSGLSVRETLRLIRYIFSYCSNKKIGTRPCFYYHLGRCPGVCSKKISVNEYKKHLLKIEGFLRGEMQITLARLKKEMHQASLKKQFEKAGRLRDQAVALQKMLEKQKIVGAKIESFDTVSLYQAGNLAGVTLFQVRLGKLIDAKNFLLENAKNAPQEEVLKSFLQRYYLEASDLPREINLPFFISGIKVLGKKQGIKFLSPTRGRKRKLIKMGEKNAKDFLEKSSQNLAREMAVATKALFELKNKLGLPEIPLRIEAYDISNTQGTSPTGSMVVFENGKAKKNDYKKFAIKSLNTPNDVAMMKEMLTRRLARAGEPEAWKLPDLMIVDGGKAQLNAVLTALKAINYKLPVIGLAKKLEEIYLPNRKSTLQFPTNSPALHLLQRIRDEAHRFAITYHRKKRSKKLLGKF